MCSIIGYSGDATAAPIMVRGLERMEYRGYDSVGLATGFGGKIETRKGVGRVSQVNAKAGLDAMSGRTGIGHTRWATHGMVTDVNAHPHSSNSGEIAIVHNGVVENFEALKEMLEGEGHVFKSETDSEVIANLLQRNHESTGDAVKAVAMTVQEIKGHYSFVAMFADGTLAAAKFHEPLIIGIGSDGLFLSSDVLGFIEYADDAVYMDNGSFAVVSGGVPAIYGFDGNPTGYSITKVSREFGDVYKGDYAHFTLKEICEQDQTIPESGMTASAGIARAAKRVRSAKGVYVTGSGTSYNAALVAKQILSRHARIKSECIVSSEFGFVADGIEKDSVLIAISQSGESADVLDAVGIARRAGCQVVSIVNLPMSSLARESDVVIGMNCGPEIGVAATKSFTSQLAILYRIVQEMTGTGVDFAEIAKAASEVLGERAEIQRVAGEMKDVTDIYVLGRGIHYPIAKEAALKLKELAYIHAEGVPGGEMKHGTLAMMDSDAVAIVINPNDSTHADTLIGAREIKARGARIVGISDVKNDVYDYWIKVPAAGRAAYPISEIIPIQLLAYYAALGRNADPDHPRNLAKSVTVK